MSLSMYQASVPAFLQTLNNLSAILDKAEAYAGNRKIDPEVLLNYRLAPDMLPFVRQIQIAADLAKGAAARLAGVEVPKHDDTEKTFADLKARITNTVTFVQSIQPSDIDGSEGRDITLTLGEHTMSFKGQPYLVHFVLPNFYFHCMRDRRPAFHDRTHRWSGLVRHERCGRPDRRECPSWPRGRSSGRHRRLPCRQCCDRRHAPTLSDRAHWRTGHRP